MHLNDCRLWCWLRGISPASRLVSLAWLLLFLGAAISAGAQEEAASEDFTDSQVKYVGMARFDVEDELGEAVSAMYRDGITVLTFPGGERLQLKDGVVIGVFDRRNSAVVARDGTQYLAGEDGRLRMPDLPRVTSHSPEGPGSPDDTSVEEADAAENHNGDIAEGDEADLIDGLKNPEGVPTMASLEKLIEDGGIKLPEPEPPPPYAVVIGTAFVMVLRLGFVIFVLVVAMHFKDLPFFMPDLVKVAVFYVAVREGVHALGNMGGNWMMISLFRIDDMSGLIALLIGLPLFKVVRSGVLVLKVAVAAKAATYTFMMLVGIVLTIVLAQLT